MVSPVVFHRRAVPSLNDRLAGKHRLLLHVPILSCLQNGMAPARPLHCIPMQLLDQIHHFVTGAVHHCLDFVPTAKMRIQLHELGTGRGFSPRI